MRRLLLILMVLVLSLVLLMASTGCSGTVIPEPPDEEVPTELIKEYIGYEQIVRWPDGIVYLYDETEYEKSQEILTDLNEIIDGPVVFQLSDNPDAQIKVEFKELAGTVFVGVESNNVYEIINVLIRINPSTADYLVYEQAFLMAVGIDLFKVEQGITEEMKTVLYWLYRLEPGYSLM